MTDTAGSDAAPAERTLVLVKPDGVGRGLIGVILARLEAKGYRLVALDIRVPARALLTEHYAGGRVTALSAGTQPGEHIHREVAEVLGRLGLDTSGERPTLLTRETIAASTMAITLGCGEECPYVPGVRYVDWPVDDPAGQDEATVRRIVADMDARVRALLVELGPDIALPASVLDA